MSLIPEVKCRRCGETFSSLRSRCPNCGTRRVSQSTRTPGATPGTVKGTASYDRAAANTRWQMIFGLILVVAVILAVIVMVSTSLNGNGASGTKATPTPAQNSDALPTAETPPTPTPSPTPPPQTSIVLTFTGDALLGSEDKLRANENSFDSVVAAQGYAYPLANFRELFSQDDYTTVNLESVLKDDSTDKLDGRLYNFRGPTSFVNILLAASVEHANIANNHYIDYGVSGRRSTRDTLQRAGIAYSGYTYTHIFEKDGVKIGFAGIRESMWHQNRATMTNEIKALKKAGCDYIVYACHWGTEYAENHNDIQKLMATYAIDAGADCVIGTHPHVVQGVEVYNGKPIFYSLGNFVFGGNLNPTDYDGLVVQMTLHFDHQVCDDVQARLIPILTSGVQDGTTNFQPVMAEGEEKDRILNRIQQDSPAEISEIMTF